MKIASSKVLWHSVQGNIERCYLYVQKIKSVQVFFSFPAYSESITPDVFPLTLVYQTKNCLNIGEGFISI